MSPDNRLWSVTVRAAFERVSLRSLSRAAHGFVLETWSSLIFCNGKPGDASYTSALPSSQGSHSHLNLETVQDKGRKPRESWRSHAWVFSTHTRRFV